MAPPSSLFRPAAQPGFAVRPRMLCSGGLVRGAPRGAGGGGTM